MMLWFSPGHFVMIVPGLARRLYRVDDALVACAAAKVAVERFCNGFPARCLPVLEQRAGPHHDARRAKTALDAALQHKSLAQDAPHLLRNTLERRDFVPVQLFGFTQAGEHWPPVNQHQAAAAGPFGSASILGRNDATLLPEELQDVHPRLVGNGDLLSIEDEADVGHFALFDEPFLGLWRFGHCPIIGQLRRQGYLSAVYSARPF